MKTAKLAVGLFGILLPTFSSASDLIVSAQVRSDSSLMLSWAGNNYGIYRVQFKTSLADPLWNDIPGETVGCLGGATRILLTTNQTQRFLRVVDWGTNGAAPLGFQDIATGDWLLSYHFSIGFISSFTNTIFVTHGGFALQYYPPGDWAVIDGPVAISLEIDQRLIFEDLMNDSRVVYVYPVRTDANFSNPINYGPNILLKLKPPFSDITGFLAEQHLTLVSYLSFIDVYVARVTRKSDDPFVMVQNLQSDPRLIYAEIDAFGSPREDPCHFGP
jgi:hypothetical protein